MPFALPSVAAAYVKALLIAFKTSDGTSYEVPRTFKTADGTSYSVPATFKTADGTSYNI